jgi:copper(I)-binding protein
MPGKKAIVTGLVVSALFMLIYNKSPQVRKLLGAA